MGKTIISPISRLKDMMIGSDRRGSFIRGSSSAQRWDDDDDENEFFPVQYMC